MTTSLSTIVTGYLRKIFHSKLEYSKKIELYIEIIFLLALYTKLSTGR